MTPERWQQIESIFHAALEREEAERPAFLEEAAGGDEELCREVKVLLISNEQAAGFIEAMDQNVVATLMAEPQSEPLIGRSFGHYQIISLLGAGGMGEVYLAQDSILGRKVAIKLLPKEFTRDRERIRRFKQEARAASALNHPNILTIFEIGEVDDLHFIAAEFVNGKTLRQRLKEAPLDLIEALDAVAQVAGALDAAHEAGFAHRDIKPENLMLRGDGYIKVLDFGLAKLIEHNLSGVVASAVTLAEPIRTDPTQVIGTPRYMSPEQIRGQRLDGRSDIFSLGVVLYELVTGHAPFEGNNSIETLAAVLNQDAPPLDRYAPQAPIGLKLILSKALKKDREERYQKAGHLRAALVKLKTELESAAKLEGDARFASADDAFATARDLDTPTSQTTLRERLEPVGGAVPLESMFYIVRKTDHEFQAAIARQDSIVLVKGARQVGKTSLLARGIKQARQTGARVVLSDFQKLAARYLVSVDELLLTLAESFADQLDLDVSPGEVWNARLSPGINFERYLRRVVFSKIPGAIVWGLDEVDRLFSCDFGSEVFGLFRSWHNERALDPQGPWRRFTLAVAYATEAHLFITDLNQSPFNVGTRLVLEDFTLEQVTELNHRYGLPLRGEPELARYFRLVGGHPYLVRRGLHEMTAHGLGLDDLEAKADHDEGPFGDHLRRLLVSLTQDASLREAMRGVLQSKPCPTPESFFRLRSSGVIAGDSARDCAPRCRLYARYLDQHL